MRITLLRCCLIFVPAIKLKQITGIMKTFILTIFKGNEQKQQKTVKVASREELKESKRGFWLESPYKQNGSNNWMGSKRIK